MNSAAALLTAAPSTSFADKAEVRWPSNARMTSSRRQASSHSRSRDTSSFMAGPNRNPGTGHSHVSRRVAIPFSGFYTHSQISRSCNPLKTLKSSLTISCNVRLERKLVGRRRNSHMGALIDLVLAHPIASAGMIAARGDTAGGAEPRRRARVAGGDRARAADARSESHDARGGLHPPTSARLCSSPPIF